LACIRVNQLPIDRGCRTIARLLRLHGVHHHLLQGALVAEKELDLTSIVALSAQPVGSFVPALLLTATEQVLQKATNATALPWCCGRRCSHGSRLRHRRALRRGEVGF